MTLTFFNECLRFMIFRIRKKGFSILSARLSLSPLSVKLSENFSKVIVPTNCPCKICQSNQNYKIPGGNLLLAQYHASTTFRFLVPTGYWCNIDIDTGGVLATPLMITPLGVDSQYWSGTWKQYWSRAISVWYWHSID